LSPGRAERHGFDYYRHRTLSLYAVLNTRTGEVVGHAAARHTSAEFVDFLQTVVEAASTIARGASPGSYVSRSKAGRSRSTAADRSNAASSSWTTRRMRFWAPAPPTRATAKSTTSAATGRLRIASWRPLLIAIAGTGSVRDVEWPSEKKAVDIGSFYSDSTKFASATGWRPTVPLEEDLRRTIAFYREHLAYYVPAEPRAERA
jgi:hypothetical protein